MSRKLTHSEFLQRVYELVGNEYSVLGTYQSNHTKITMKHEECGTVWDITPAHFVSNGRRCTKCRYKRLSKTKTTNLNDMLVELNKHRPDLIYIDGYINKRTKLKIKSVVCGHEWEAKFNNLVNKKSGCPKCHGFKSTDDFKRVIKEKYNNLYEIKGEYINNRTPITVKHIECGYEWEVIPKDLLKRFRCPGCNKSYGERLVTMYLNERKLDFETEVSFEDCRYKNLLKFDFKVNTENGFVLVEVDGLQHYKNTRSTYSTEEVFVRDAIKNEYCLSKDIKLIRLPYWYFRSDLYIRKLDELLGVERSETIENTLN